MSSLKDLRRAAGLTQHALAVEIGALAAQVAGWEAGRSSPSIKYVKPLAQALGVSTDEVLDAITNGPAKTRAS